MKKAKILVVGSFMMDLIASAPGYQIWERL